MHALARHRKIDYFLCVTGGIFSALVCPGYLILVLRSPTTFPHAPCQKSDLIVNTYEIDIITESFVTSQRGRVREWSTAMLVCDTVTLNPIIFLFSFSVSYWYSLILFIFGGYILTFRSTKCHPYPSFNCCCFQVCCVTEFTNYFIFDITGEYY